MRTLSSLLLGLLLLASAASAALAQSPAREQIPYQGFLTDASGTPLTQTLSIKFKLTDAAGGSWSETASVDVAEGQFTHYLGSTAAITGVDFTEDPVELTLTIDPTGSPETLGAVPLGAVPTAYEVINGGSGGFALPFSGSGAVDGVDNAVFSVENTGTGDGVRVGSAGDDGVQVGTAGGAGLFVGSAGGDGVQIFEAGGAGVDIGSAGGNGFIVDVAGDTDGDGTADNTNADGVEVGTTGGDGFFVDVAGDTNSNGTADNIDANGVEVGSAGGDGVEIGSAGVFGVYVGSAGGEGFVVDVAGDTDGDGNPDISSDGVEVGSAGGDGVYVRSAGGDGVQVGSAGGDGFVVDVAGDTDGDGNPDPGQFSADGVEVGSAGGDGVYVRSAGDKGIEATGDNGNYLSHSGTGQRDPDLILGGASNTLSGDNGVLSSDPSYESSDLFFVSNDGVAVVLDNDGQGDTSSDLNVQDKDGSSLFRVDQDGDGTFTGNLTAASKNFLIDHPLDPRGRTLRHASVESNELLVSYSGNVTTGAKGEAVVQLPDYVEALATDFRYQLTVIGTFAQAIVGREIAGGQFTIRTSEPGVKVSWRVEGVRQDAWAQENPLVVEEAKATGAEDGLGTPGRRAAPEGSPRNR